MKKSILFSILILLIQGAQSQTKNFLDQAYLEVAGIADTLVIPNEIYLRIMISEKDTKDKISVEELELKMYDALKAIGIDLDKNLTTNGMASNFKSYLFRDKDVIKTKTYNLLVGDANTASKVFIELEKLGISNASIDRVGHSEMNMLKNEMRSKAVSDAKMRAVALTRPLGQTIGQAIYIAENDGFGPIVRTDNNLQEIVVAGYASRDKNVLQSPKIDFEKIKIVSSVNVKFVLKP